jgi:hypothetical protein
VLALRGETMQVLPAAMHGLVVLQHPGADRSIRA